MRRVLAALAVAFVACGGGGPASGTLEGLITEASADEVTVEPEDGDPQTFVNGDDNVSVAHLHEHRVQELPVVVHWERRDGERVAVRIDDA